MPDLGNKKRVGEVPDFVYHAHPFLSTFLPGFVQKGGAACSMNNDKILHRFFPLVELPKPFDCP